MRWKGRAWFDMASMTRSQKVMMREFEQQMFDLWEKHWNPTDSDEYWDELVVDATNLISNFQTKDIALNNFFSNIVATFLNSREELVM